MKKVTKEDFGIKTAGMPEEQTTFMNNMLDSMCDVVNKAMDGILDKEGVENKFKEINESLKNFDNDKFKQIIKDNEDLCTQVKALGETIEKMKQKGIGIDVVNKFDEKLDEMLNSEKYQEFAQGTARKSGAFNGFSLKDIVSMTDNYTGSVQIAQQTNTVVSQSTNKKIHMRNIVKTLSGDPQFPTLSYTQVYDFDRNARYVTENGTLPASSIKAKEVQTGTKRLGTHMKISQRMLKSRVFIRSYILNNLPEAIFMAEDWNMLFGNGNGENLQGIANQPGVTPVETIITDAVASGIAGSVKSVTTEGNDTIVEFANAQSLILDGMKVTFAGATQTALNATFDVIKMNDREILLKGVKLTTAEATADKMTFSANNAAFKSVEAPNYGDVINTLVAVMMYAQYSPNVIVLNPITLNTIKSEKDTTGHNLGLITNVNGLDMIAGLPIVANSSIPAGKYLIGDFNLGANLVDYTSLSLEWAEDVDTKLSNEIVLIAQEEIIFPVYMPWAFSYGDLTALKTAITKS